MDAEKLPQVTSKVPSSACGASVPNHLIEQPCAPARCRLSCSLEVIQNLLGDSTSISGDDADLLLDLHQLIKARQDAEGTLRVFCELRRRLERKQYLAFYRIRRWLEAHIIAEVRSEVAVQTVPLRLTFYCVEAIRRLCLCAGLNRGIGGPKVTLSFSYIPADISSTAQDTMNHARA